MASGEELNFVLKYGPFKGQRVLQLGSSIKFAAEVKAALGAKECFGLDMRPHENTDIVHNLNSPIDLDPFDTVICMSVLEHCDKPWLVAPNITKLVKTGGLLLVGVPFWWRVHDHPADYWRMTPMAIKVLFPEDEYEYLEEATWPPNTNLAKHDHKHVEVFAAMRKIV